MSKRKHAWMQAISLLLAFGLLIASQPATAVLPVKADEISDLEQQKEELEKQQQELEQKKAALATDLDSQKQRKAYLDEQIALKTQEIELNARMIADLDERLYQKEQEIAQKEREIADKEAAIAVKFAELQERLRTVAKTGNLSALQMLLNTESFVDYLLKSKLMETIAANDQQLIDGIEAEIEAIGAEKASLEADKATLETQRAELQELQRQADADKEELDSLGAEAQSVIQSLQSDMAYYADLIAEAQAKEAALQERIDQLMEELNNSNTPPEDYKGGTMYWPSKSMFIVTSTFGYRPEFGSWHRGIDIACPGSAYGKDIVAAADGTVVYVNDTNSWGSGWGYHVILDHGVDASGRRIMTLYAHCSSILVSEGDRVVGGETQIARAGNTGNSYGAHLHFEVYEDGVRVDPIKNGYVVVP